MRKIVLMASVLLLLAAACNQSASVQTTPPTPTPQQQTTQTPPPSPAASNIFKFYPKIGEKYGAMTVTEVSHDDKVCCNIKVTFSGNVTITGRLAAPTSNPADAGMGPKYSLNDLTTDSLKKLPYLETDTRSVWFGVRNPEVMKNFQVKNGDTVEMTINKYYYNYSPTDSWNEADVVAVKKVNSAAGDTTSLRTYTNSDYNFTVQFPSNASVYNGSTLTSSVLDSNDSYLGRFSGDLAFISLVVPENSGINSAEVLISFSDTPSIDPKHPSDIQYSFVAVDKSKGIPPPVIEELKLEKTVTINGIVWGVAEKDGAALGAHGHTTIYHTYHNNLWYEVLINLRTSSDGNGKAPDTTQIQKQLQDILSSFKFTK